MRLRRPTLSDLSLQGAGGLLALLMVPTIVAVVALAVLLGRQLEHELRNDALESAELAGKVFASLTFDADEFTDGRLNEADTLGDLDEGVKANPSIDAVRLYTAPNRVLYATDSRVEGPIAPAPEVRRAFAGETTSEVTTLSEERARAGVRTRREGGHVLEVNMPIRPPGVSRPTLVATVYLPYGKTREAIAAQIAQTRLLVAGVALLLLIVLVPLTARGARTLAGGRRHVQFQREMHRALENDELVLHYQPQVNVTTGAVVGTEALVRWDHPVRGLLGPDHFIPKAEETGLIDRLTEKVFDIALAQVARWRLDGIELPPVAVNLSAVTLANTQLSATLAELLERHQVDSRDVVIEMTESSMMTKPELSQSMLGELDRMGFGLSIDDFGTGYSSLARLDQLPLTEMKIDRSFVARMEERATGRLVSTMIDLAHELGMLVVGEGVETQEILDLLEEAGCDVAQGYHFARPMPAEALGAWLAERAPALR